MTEHRQSELAEAVTQARFATLGLLVAGLAHEINTPIGALNSNHDVLRRALARLQAILADEVVEPHELDEVRRIVRAVDGVLRVNDLAMERITGLIDSLRSFGRLDRSDIDVIDVHEGLESTLAILAHELRPLNVVRAYGTLPPIECHAQQINQVFMNLLLNARQASPNGSTITVTTQAIDEAVLITITDEGSGIAPEHLARIFEPGFTTKGGRIGMGLGLLISRQIVERHGGTISVVSSPGAGAAFTVRLPVRLHATSQRDPENSQPGSSA